MTSTLTFFSKKTSESKISILFCYFKFVESNKPSFCRTPSSILFSASVKRCVIPPPNIRVLTFLTQQPVHILFGVRKLQKQASDWLQSASTLAPYTRCQKAWYQPQETQNKCENSAGRLRVYTGFLLLTSQYPQKTSDYCLVNYSIK